MIIENVNVNKLHDEFNNAGIKPYPVFELENGVGDFIFTDGTDMELVRQIISDHDPTLLPPVPTKSELMERELASTNAMILELTELIVGGM